MAMDEAQSGAKPGRRGSGTLFWILALCAALAIGLFVGYRLGDAAGFKQGVQEGLQSAREIAVDSGLIPEEAEPDAQTSRTLAGTISGISGRELTLDVESDQSDPFAASETPQMRTVLIAEGAALIDVAEKTPAELEEEFNAFDAAVAQGLDREPPELETRTPIEFEDLAVGDFVSLTANGDIRSSESFEAVLVERQVSLLIPPPTVDPPLEDEIEPPPGDGPPLPPEEDPIP